MKLYLCEILNSASPAIITILLGNISEPVGKIAVAFDNASVHVSSAAPPRAKIQYDDGIISNQYTIVKSSNVGKSKNEAIIEPAHPMVISVDCILKQEDRMITYQPSAMMHEDDKKPP